MIVIISVFNLFAYIIYVDEKKSREFFLLQALGMGKKMIVKYWVVFIVTIWLMASMLSIVLSVASTTNQSRLTVSGLAEKVFMIVLILVASGSSGPFRALCLKHGKQAALPRKARHSS